MAALDRVDAVGAVAVPRALVGRSTVIPSSAGIGTVTATLALPRVVFDRTSPSVPFFVAATVALGLPRAFGTSTSVISTSSLSSMTGVFRPLTLPLVPAALVSLPTSLFSSRAFTTFVVPRFLVFLTGASSSITTSWGSGAGALRREVVAAVDNFAFAAEGLIVLVLVISSVAALLAAALARVMRFGGDAMSSAMMGR